MDTILKVFALWMHNLKDFEYHITIKVNVNLPASTNVNN